LITREEAMSNAIGDIMKKERLLKRFDKIHVAHLVSLWERLSAALDLLLKDPSFRVTWNCEEVTYSFRTINEAPLMAFLSEGLDPSDGNDLVFLVIDSIVAKYNRYVERFAELSEDDCKIPILHPKMILPGTAGSAAINLLPLLSQQELDAIAMASWQDDTKSFNTRRVDLLVRRETVDSSRPPLIASPLKCLREQFSFRVVQTVKTHITVNSDFVFAGPSGLLFAREHDLELVMRIQRALNDLQVTQGDEGIKGPLKVAFQGLESHQQVAAMLGGLCALLDLLMSVNMIGFRFLADAVESVNLGTSFEDILPRLGFPALNTSQRNLLASLGAQQVFELAKYLGYQLATEGYLYSHADLCTADPLREDSKYELQSSIRRLCSKEGPKATLGEVDSFIENVLMFCKDWICQAASQSAGPLPSFLVDSNLCDAKDAVLACIPSDVSVRNYVALRQLFHQVRLSLLLQQSDECCKLLSADQHLPPTSKANGSCWLWEGDAHGVMDWNLTHELALDMTLWFISENDSESATEGNHGVRDETLGSREAAGHNSTSGTQVTTEVSKIASATRIQRWCRGFCFAKDPRAFGNTRSSHEGQGDNKVPSESSQSKKEKFQVLARRKMKEAKQARSKLASIPGQLREQERKSFFTLQMFIFLSLFTVLCALIYGARFSKTAFETDFDEFEF
jgi:hypothetical protein